jgi:hypothetical protein
MNKFAVLPRLSEGAKEALMKSVQSGSQPPEEFAKLQNSHVGYLEDLKSKGKLFAAGPFTDFSGGLIIYQAESLEEAKALANNDPFVKGKVFVDYTIHEWHQAV